MLRVLILISISIILELSSAAQCPDLPEEFVMETPADYEKYEDMSFEVMDCLVNQPSELSAEERQMGEAFSLIWLGGTPNYTIHVDTSILKFTDELPQLLYIYMFSLALVQRDNTDLSAEQIEAEALHLVGQHYLNGDYSEKSKYLKKVVKKYESGKLLDYLKSVRS